MVCSTNNTVDYGQLDSVSYMLDLNPLKKRVQPSSELQKAIKEAKKKPKEQISSITFPTATGTTTIPIDSTEFVPKLRPLDSYDDRDFKVHDETQPSPQKQSSKGMDASTQAAPLSARSIKSDTVVENHRYSNKKMLASRSQILKKSASEPVVSPRWSHTSPRSYQSVDTTPRVSMTPRIRFADLEKSHLGTQTIPTRDTREVELQTHELIEKAQQTDPSQVSIRIIY